MLVNLVTVYLSVNLVMLCLSVKLVYGVNMVEPFSGGEPGASLNLYLLVNRPVVVLLVPVYMHYIYGYNY